MFYIEVWMWYSLLSLSLLRYILSVAEKRITNYIPIITIIIMRRPKRTIFSVFCCCTKPVDRSVYTCPRCLQQVPAAHHHRTCSCFHAALDFPLFVPWPNHLRAHLESRSPKPLTIAHRYGLHFCVPGAILCLPLILHETGTRGAGEIRSGPRSVAKNGGVVFYIFTPHRALAAHKVECVYTYTFRLCP